MNKKLKIIIVVLFLVSLIIRGIGIYDLFYGLDFIGDQHDDFWSLENIISISPALFSLSGIFIFYYFYKRHLTRKYFNWNEIIDLILIVYVFFDVSCSIFYYLLSNITISFG